MAKKYFILDASVFLSAGKRALFAFKDNHVIIPISVIETLESKKSDPQLGFAAINVLKELDNLDLHTHQHKDSELPLSYSESETPAGGSIRIEFNHVDTGVLGKSMKADGDFRSNKILAIAKNYQNEHPDDSVILVTNNSPLRLRATIVGIEASPFKISSRGADYYSGYVTDLDVSDQVFSALHETNKTKVPVEIPAKVFSGHTDLPANFGAQFVSGASRTAALVSKKNGKFYAIRSTYSKDYGNEFTPGSPQQYLAADYIAKDSPVQVLSIGGAAGTGKTALALAAGVNSLNEDDLFRKDEKDSKTDKTDRVALAESPYYDKIIVFRPMIAVGRQDYGFLPGDADEKMEPWAAAVYDALAASCSDYYVKQVKSKAKLEVLPVTHLRGRTFMNTLMIVDEAQNLEPVSLLTALSRAGAGSKVVFLWDKNQRDNLDISKDDGIASIVDYFKNTPEFAHITFEKSERSRIAELANQALEDLGL